MTSLFDKLNLRPQERRLVVIVSVVVFIVLNVVFVFPNFGALGQIQQRTDDARKKLDTYKSEIRKQPNYQRDIDTLKGQGAEVATEAQALTLALDVDSQARLAGVTATAITPMQRTGAGGKTNAFFEEQSVVVNVICGEKELIDFLFRLADKDLLIRAKSLQVSPDPQTRMRLQGPITLVKSFQRKTPTKPAQTTPSSAGVIAAASTNRAVASTNPAAAATATVGKAAVKLTNAPPKAPGVQPFTPPGGTNRIRRSAPTQLK